MKEHLNEGGGFVCVETFYDDAIRLSKYVDKGWCNLHTCVFMTALLKSLLLRKQLAAMPLLVL